MTTKIGPGLVTVTVRTSDNSVARCLIGAFDATVIWCPDRVTATIVIDNVGARTIGLIASFGKVSLSLT